MCKLILKYLYESIEVFDPECVLKGANVAGQQGTTEDLGFCKRTVLDNGITVVSEHMDDVRSISLGLWMNTGSRDEKPDQAGLSHFMEHMTFKGTNTRNAFDINRAFDGLGAESNAFTGKEATCFYARFVDEKLSDVFEILADMLVNSTYTNETIEPERKVVLEEIARSYDAPDDYVFDLFTKTLLAHHPLGKPVLGDKDLVANFNHNDCMRYKNEHYYTGNLCVAASGHVDHDELVEMCSRLFVKMNKGTKQVRHAQDARPSHTFVSDTRDTQQAHVVVGMPWLSVHDPRRYAGYTLSQILGGSMSSRLFTEVREKRGLVYSIYASPVTFSDTGIFTVYAGTRPENVGEVIRLVCEELKKIARDGVSEEELSRATESVCGQILLGEESTITRMLRLGRLQTLGNDLICADDMVERYRSVTQDDVQKIAKEYLLEPPTVALVSSIEKDKAQSIVNEALESN